MREIKFRAKRISNGKWLYWDIWDQEGYGDEPQNLCLRDTVCQYTGLKDIYEGDIVKTKRGVGEVRWDSRYCGFQVWFENNEDGESLGNFRDEIEIIGNIWENPDLLN